MKFLPAILLLQVLDLTRAQSDCPRDMDTFEDGLGERCSFYQGKDCVAVARDRGLDQDDKMFQLLASCRHACGYCGEDTIVKECKDDSCQCKDTEYWNLIVAGETITCDQQSIGSCMSNAINYNLSDEQIREYFTNCAASCKICRPCSTIINIGDGLCDAGNNNDNCFDVSDYDGTETARFDGGDCCNEDTATEADFYSGANSIRYLGCVLSNTAYDKTFCKCLDPASTRAKDCVGQWSEYGECSVTCGVGVSTREFVVLNAAESGGHQCEFAAGHTEQEPCGRAWDVCPTTTTILTTTTTTTTTPAAATIQPNTQESTNVTADPSDKVSEDCVTTVSTMLATSACLIYLLV